MGWIWMLNFLHQNKNFIKLWKCLSMEENNNLVIYHDIRINIGVHILMICWSQASNWNWTKKQKKILVIRWNENRNWTLNHFLRQRNTEVKRNILTKPEQQKITVRSFAEKFSLDLNSPIWQNYNLKSIFNSIVCYVHP